VSALIELVGSKTRRLLDGQYPRHATFAPGRHKDLVITAPVSGVVCEVRHDKLVKAARRADCSLVKVPALGEFVPAGAPMFKVTGSRATLPGDDAVDAVVLGLERTLEHDVAYGFRMLVDIAVRSIPESPLQDPTTAVQAIDRLHDCLRQLADRSFPDGVYRDGDGIVRLTVPVMDWDRFVLLSFEEIRRAGAASPQVSRRLIAALDDLRDITTEDRRAVLDHERRLLREATEASRQPGADPAFDLVPDGQGIGVRASPEPGNDRADRYVDLPTSQTADR